jgi:YhcH/YjgK/YiaL family protein
MIVDRIENARLYAGYGHGVAEALDYLGRTDLTALANGKHELDGERLFVVVQRYQPKPPAEARWEYHEKYLDVQFIAAGAEAIGYAPWDAKLPVVQAFDAAKDAGLVAASGAMLPIAAGMFAIFAPRELHAPCIAIDGAKSDVLKVIVKCRWAG